MANTFDWVEITARNVAETAGFYERLFGWRIIQRDTADGFDVWNFDTGGEPRLENLRRGGIWERPDVGSYRPNGFGLHDMQGHVVEWVADFYDAATYASGPAVNPQGPERGRFRMIRGGGWHSGASCNRVYYRNALPPNWVDFNVGFRCVRDVE